MTAREVAPVALQAATPRTMVNEPAELERDAPAAQPQLALAHADSLGTPPRRARGAPSELIRDVALLGLIWGVGVVLQRLALAEVGPFSLVLLRLAAAAAFFFPFMPRICRTIVWRPRWLLDVGVVGILNPGASAIFSALALQFASSGLVSVLASLGAIFAAAVSRLVLREAPLRLFQAIGLGAAFVGVAILVGSGHSGLGAELDGDHRGQLLALLIALSQALSTVYAGRRLKNTEPLTAAAGQTIAALLITIPLFIAAGEPLPLGSISLTAWLAIVLSGSVGIGASYVLLSHMVHKYGPTSALLSINLTPVTAATLGVLFLGETVTGEMGAGAALVLAGIFLFCRR